jgi:hypothetical protein
MRQPQRGMLFACWEKPCLDNVIVVTRYEERPISRKRKKSYGFDVTGK